MKKYNQPDIKTISIEGNLMEDVLSVNDESGDDQLSNSLEMDDAEMPKTNSVWDQ